MKHKYLPYIIGTGLALFPLQNASLTALATINGETFLYLPALGYGFLMVGIISFISSTKLEIRFTNKWVEVPLIALAVSMTVSGIVYAESLSSMLAPAFLSMSLLWIYFVAHNLGASIYKAMIPFVILGTVVAIVQEIADPTNLTGGLITNSTAMSGYLILGALTNQIKKQWLLCLTALIGILFLGALEGIFMIGVVSLVLLFRKDFSRWFILSVGISLVILYAGMVQGVLTPIFGTTRNLSTFTEIATGQLPATSEALDVMTTGRWTINADVIRNITPFSAFFGHGLYLGARADTAHNIPLIIVQQIGIPGAIAWSIVTLYCLILTKWKYLWLAVLAMCFFDHFLWTQFIPFWFALVGTSLIPIKSDLIFRKSIDVTQTI